MFVRTMAVMALLGLTGCAQGSSNYVVEIGIGQGVQRALAESETSSVVMRMTPGEDEPQSTVSSILWTPADFVPSATMPIFHESTGSWGCDVGELFERHITVVATMDFDEGSPVDLEDEANVASDSVIIESECRRARISNIATLALSLNDSN